MKIYPVNNLQPVNSRQRQRQQVYIPPFNFPSYLTVGQSGKWVPSQAFELVGGYISAKGVGLGTASILVIKDNIFETNQVAASVSLAASDKFANFTLVNVLSGNLIFTPNDYLSVASFAASNHENITIQLYGLEVN